MTSSTPSAWTPSTQSSARSASARSRLRAARASAIWRTGSLSAGAGVDPGDRDDAGVRPDLRRAAPGRSRRPWRRRTADRAARSGDWRPCRAVAGLERLVGGVEVVGGRQDVLVGPEAEAVVEQPEAHRGAVGQRDVGGAGTEVGAGRAQDGRLGGSALLAQVQHGIGVQPLAVRLDRLADGRRVRGEIQPAEVQVLRCEREQVADGRPGLKVAGWRGRRAPSGGGIDVGRVARAALREGGCRERQAGSVEERASVHAESMPGASVPVRELRQDLGDGDGHVREVERLCGHSLAAFYRRSGSHGVTLARPPGCPRRTAAPRAASRAPVYACSRCRPGGNACLGRPGFW